MFGLRNQKNNTVWYMTFMLIFVFFAQSACAQVTHAEDIPPTNSQYVEIAVDSQQFKKALCDCDAFDDFNVFYNQNETKIVNTRNLENDLPLGLTKVSSLLPEIPLSSRTLSMDLDFSPISVEKPWFPVLARSHLS